MNSIILYPNPQNFATNLGNQLFRIQSNTLSTTVKISILSVTIFSTILGLVSNIVTFRGVNLALGPITILSFLGLLSSLHVLESDNSLSDSISNEELRRKIQEAQSVMSKEAGQEELNEQIQQLEPFFRKARNRREAIQDTQTSPENTLRFYVSTICLSEVRKKSLLQIVESLTLSVSAELHPKDPAQKETIKLYLLNRLVDHQDINGGDRSTYEAQSLQELVDLVKDQT